MEILEQAYYRGDSNIMAEGTVLHILVIYKHEDMLECIKYDKNGKYLGRQMHPLSFVKKWAKERVIPRGSKRH